MPYSKPNSSTRSAADDEEDLDLLGKVNAGDREAFRRLYVKYYDALLGFILSITRQLSAAQEGVNDVMLVVWKNGHKFAGRSKVRTWIMGIAYRRSLKLAQSQRRWTERFKNGNVDDVIEPSDPQSEPSQSIEAADRIEAALRLLPEKQRAVVELIYRFGYSYEEIANVIGCPVNTVKTRMFHARAALKRAAPEEFDGE